MCSGCQLACPKLSIRSLTSRLWSKAVLLILCVGCFLNISQLLWSDTWSSCTWLVHRSCTPHMTPCVNFTAPKLFYTHLVTWVHWWCAYMSQHSLFLLKTSKHFFDFCTLNFNTTHRPPFKSPHILNPLVKLFWGIWNKLYGDCITY